MATHVFEIKNVLMSKKYIKKFGHTLTEGQVAKPSAAHKRELWQLHCEGGLRVCGRTEGPMAQCLLERMAVASSFACAQAGPKSLSNAPVHRRT